MLDPPSVRSFRMLQAGTILNLSPSSIGTRLPSQRAKRSIAPIFGRTAVIALGVFLTSAAIYPGFISGDSSWQLEQARDANFDDWHPVIMSYIWRYLDLLVPGAAGLFLFHSLLFWTGVTFFAWHSFSRHLTAAGAALLAGLYVPITAAFAVVGKDSGLLAALAFSCGMLLHSQQKASGRCLFLGLCGLWYAFSIRHNAFTGIVPLTIWAGFVLYRHFLPFRLKLALGTTLRRYAIGLSLFLAIATLSFSLETFIIRPKRSHMSQAVMLFDIVAISVDAKTNYLPPFYARHGVPISLSALEESYNPTDCTQLLWGDDSVVPRPGFLWDDYEYPILVETWTKVIAKHPLSYLKHRLSVFKALVGIGIQQNWPYWFPSREKLEQDSSWNAGTKERLVAGVMAMRNSFIFKAWFYLVLTGVVLVAGLIWGVKMKAPFWALAWSAILYELSYFALAPSSDFRYSWWPVCVTFLLPMLLGSRRRTSDRPGPLEMRVFLKGLAPRTKLTATGV